LVIRTVLGVSNNFLLFNEEIEDSIHYGPLDSEYLGSFISLDDSLLDWLSDNGFLDHHVLLVVDAEPSAKIFLLLRKMSWPLLGLFNYEIFPHSSSFALNIYVDVLCRLHNITISSCWICHLCVLSSRSLSQPQIGS
jgi:hypothetical protein